MRLVLLGTLLHLPMSGTALAQGIGCVLQTAAGSQRQILRCRDGLTIEAEAGATYNLVDQNRDTQPDAVNLQSRAIFIDAPAQSARQGFQIMTPQAIAAVRGTQWAVDVSGSQDIRLRGDRPRCGAAGLGQHPKRQPRAWRRCRCGGRHVPPRGPTLACASRSRPPRPSRALEPSWAGDLPFR